MAQQSLRQSTEINNIMVARLEICDFQIHPAAVWNNEQQAIGGRSVQSLAKAVSEVKIVQQVLNKESDDDSNLAQYRIQSF